MKIIILFSSILCFLSGIALSQNNKIVTIESNRSPVNQVFQFAQSLSCEDWADGASTNATLYLWIPETCMQLRGLLIMGANVPEHMLVGHSAIRKVCADNNLGIIWSTPSFMNFKKSTTSDGKNLNMAIEYKTIVDFLQQLLNGLAEKSGYPEVATVPWLPMGESAHLLMVDALMEQSPERCMAGIFIKNNHLPPKNRDVPTLVAFGTAQEWGQDKIDIRTRWNDVDGAYKKIVSERTKNPNWPLSYIIDGSSGHFDCSEKLVKYFADYINLVAKFRLSDDGSTTLKPVQLNKGFLAHIPIAESYDKPVVAYLNAKLDEKAFPWFFEKESANEAQSFARINWKAETQLPAFMDDSGNVAPFSFNGISKLIPTDMGSDGITFGFKPVMLDVIPSNFVVGAGEKLVKTKNAPTLEWLCGQFKPIGSNQFQVSLDRMYPTMTSYLGVRQNGDDTIRTVFQPGGLTIPKNNTGIIQNISFEKIKDVTVGTKSVPLVASSDSGLEVNYYVVSGPAIIENDKLIFTKIPPKSKFPITVTVAAWQWGRAAEPQVKMADIIKQDFSIKNIK